ncbi:hypothetical protein B0H14DRAFT_3501155 [Mycena olivaceomarginata]|nr:hypothetical protein B0H14DRAFT_3501155 [Mycena olivaceomarginata]
MATPLSASLTRRPCPAQTAATLHNLVLVLGAGTHVPAASPDADAPAASSVTPAAVPHLGFQTRGPWVAGVLFLVVPTGPLTHIPEDPVPEGFEPLWYCITRGKHIGVTIHNSLAMAAVVGVSRSSMKSYKAQALAVTAFNEMLQFNLVQVLA